MIVRILACVWLLVLGVVLVPPAVLAETMAQDDGFGSADKIETTHFTIYYKHDVDIRSLNQQMQISATDEAITGMKVDDSTPEKGLASKVEVLFSRAMGVLDMHVYSLKDNIKVFATQQQLTDFYNNMFHTSLPCTGFAFYLDDTRSIYMSAENFRREILGHEMGHAIMSRYFVVQPSMRVQEVLAGYIEYQLRKGE